MLASLLEIWADLALAWHTNASCLLSAFNCDIFSVGQLAVGCSVNTVQCLLIDVAQQGEGGQPRVSLCVNERMFKVYPHHRLPQRAVRLQHRK